MKGDPVGFWIFCAPVEAGSRAPRTGEVPQLSFLEGLEFWDAPLCCDPDFVEHGTSHLQVRKMRLGKKNELEVPPSLWSKPRFSRSTLPTKLCALHCLPGAPPRCDNPHPVVSFGEGSGVRVLGTECQQLG